MPKKIARPQAPCTAENLKRLAEIEARNSVPRRPRPGSFDLDQYVDDLASGVVDRPGIVPAHRN